MASILKLTPRRIRIYNFIVKYKIAHDGLAPSVLEMTRGCGISSTSIVRHDLIALIVLGMINYGVDRKSRMISIPGGRWIPPLPVGQVISPVKKAARARSSSSLTS